MTFGGYEWDYKEHLDMLLYPSSKFESIRIIGLTILFFIPIVIMMFFSFIISGILGFFYPGENPSQCIYKCEKEVRNGKRRI